MTDTFLFDMDGVLIDSEPVSIRILMDWFLLKGVRLTRKDVEPYLGAGEEVFFTGPAGERGMEVDLAEASLYFKEHYPSLMAASMDDCAKALSCALVRHLRALGFKVAVCSSAPHWKVLANIRVIGLDEDDFDLVLSGEEVVNNKPDGEIYRKAAARLGSDPASCIVVEDSRAGVMAGLDAGMKVLGIAGTVDVSTLCSWGACAASEDIGILLGGSTMEQTVDILARQGDETRLFGANMIRVRRPDAPAADIQEMIEAAKRTREHAYTPYSNFKVGACVRSAATGRIYTGCNVENSSFGATVCAERNAILHAIAEEGTIGIDALVVVSDDDPPAPPCAMCLQVLAEFTAPDAPVILSSLKGDVHTYVFSELLPKPFIFPSQRKE